MPLAQPWIIKYRPRRIDEVVGQERAKKTLVAWVKSWLGGREPEKKAALLYGPPGVGKTSLVEAIAREYGLEVVEMNASDYRRRSDIERVVRPAIDKRSLFSRGVIVLLDEVDGLNPREDLGGVQALAEVIDSTRNPIIMTANDPWKDFLKPIRDRSLLVEFKPLTTAQIVEYLERICRLEGVECEREALRYIADKSMGDMRAAVNDLQVVVEGYGRASLDLVKAIIKGRDKSLDVWRTLSEVFYARYAWSAKRAVSQSEMDYEELIQWLNDNIPRKYSEASDVYRALDALARATLFLNRAKYRGHWSLLSYVFDLMGPGVAFAREGEISKARYGYPDRIKMLAKFKASREVRERIAEHLSPRLLVSKSTVKNEVIPLLMVIFRQAPSPVPAARLALGYSMTKEMVSYLAGPRAGEVIKAMEGLKRKLQEAQASKKTGESKPGRGERRDRRSRSTLDFFFKK